MPMQRLDRAFARLAAEMRIARDDWWVFGSAAVALFGLQPERVKDIDVIVSPADAGRLMRTHGLANLADGGTGTFRSDILLAPAFGDVPVEILANFQIRAADGWQPVRPQTRVAVALGGGRLYVPARDELAAIFRRCGRASDYVHARMLEAADRG
jgi:hypothetical protein